jgi:hypothetical protein
MKSPEVKPCCLPLQRDDKTQPAIVVPLANQLGGDVAILAPAQPILVLSSADPDFARYHSTSPPRHLDLLLLHSRLNIWLAAPAFWRAESIHLCRLGFANHLLRRMTMLNKTTLFALTLALASIAPLASAATEGKCCCKGGDCCAGAKSTSASVKREVPIRETTEAQRWDGTTKPTAQQFTRR